MTTSLKEAHGKEQKTKLNLLEKLIKGGFSPEEARKILEGK